MQQDKTPVYSVKQNSTDVNNNLSCLIGEKRTQASLSDVDDVMKELGLTKCITEPKEEQSTKGKRNNIAQNITVISKGFKNNEYIYIDLTVNSKFIKKGDFIEISYIPSQVYAVNYYHSDSLRTNRLTIGYDSFQVKNPKGELWIGLLYKFMNPDKNVILPLTISIVSNKELYSCDTFIHLQEK